MFSQLVLTAALASPSLLFVSAGSAMTQPIGSVEQLRRALDGVPAATSQQSGGLSQVNRAAATSTT